MALEIHPVGLYRRSHCDYALPWLCHDHPPAGAPPEKLLQRLWLHQRIRREGLRTVDGRLLRVLHPGFWNREAGPDFRRAIVQWEAEVAQQGDIEIDLHSSGWRSHGHHRRSDYSAVILHVVWKAESPCLTPTLELQNQLDAPWEELAQWEAAASTPRWPATMSGQCRVPLRTLSEAEQHRLLQAAAETRFEAKAERIRLRAATVGAEQAFWEFILRTLGYKQNPWPMQHLGELLPRIRQVGDTTQTLQAKLLGVSGLLPAEVRQVPTAARPYLRSLWDIWWRAQHELGDLILPRSVWHLHHLRPANHPQRRLALAAHWLSDADLLPRLRAWGHRVHPTPKRQVEEFRQALRIPEDDFWSHHWTFRCAATDSKQPLLGTARLTDLAINAALPWLWMDACRQEDREQAGRIKARYLAWPSAQDNTVLKLARLRLLSGDSTRNAPKTAAMQQGLMQIVSDFCEHSDALCQGCPFPELLEGWR